MKIRIYDIDWCVEDEDFDDQEELENIINGLPKEVKVEIKGKLPKDELEDTLCNYLSDNYCYLVNTFYYEELKEAKNG